MPAYQLNINNTNYTVEAEAPMPLLWVLRDILDLTGTKYGCGLGVCGACTVLIDNRALRSCQVAVSACTNTKIITVEGLSEDGTHPVQQAWDEENVPQCGYCQSGQIMAVAGMLNTAKRPTPRQINETMSQIVCRCGTYHRIRKAINKSIELVNK
jgi:aerobic-type carbon monoxide dehydrogenase small subunit (CoxS/CutS family)